MPSTPSFPAGRAGAARPAGSRDYESYDNSESAALTIPAGTAFTEVITFGGRPDAVIIDASAAALEVRFRNRGEAPRAPIRIQSAGERRFNIVCEIVEARDPAGAGGQFLTATGRWASRHIDVRNNYPGPAREPEMLPASARAIQAPPAR